MFFLLSLDTVSFFSNNIIRKAIVLMKIWSVNFLSSCIILMPRGRERKTIAVTSFSLIISSEACIEIMTITVKFTTKTSWWWSWSFFVIRFLEMKMMNKMIGEIGISTWCCRADCRSGVVGLWLALFRDWKPRNRAWIDLAARSCSSFSCSVSSSGNNWSGSLTTCVF